MDLRALVSLALFTATAVSACAPPPARASKTPVGSPRVRMVPGTRDRAALEGSSFELGAARAAIVEAAKKGVVFLDIHDATHSVLLELPPTPTLDDVASVVVVRLDSAARYGTTKPTDSEALEAAARRDGGTRTVALLRVADDITLDRLIAALIGV